MRKGLLTIGFVLILTDVLAQVIVNGLVKDSSTGEPLSSALIQLGEQNTLSNEDGTFAFASVKRGEHLIRVIHLGCEPLVFHISVQRDTFLLILLAHHIHQLDNVHVTALSRNSAQTHSDPRSAIVISETLISQNGASQISEVLGKETGVQSLSTGAGINKPVIHGLHSNRLAIITGNGRLESQQWGQEHAPEIDPFTYGNIVLTKGAGSLRYSGDAPGGVIYMQPIQFMDSTYASYFIRGSFDLFSMNSNAFAFKMEHHNKEKRIGNRFTANFKQAGDASAPDYVLSNTAYLQGSASNHLQLHFRGADLSWTNTYFHQKVGILYASHIGNLSDLERAFLSDTPLVNKPFSKNASAPFQLIDHLSSGLSLSFNTAKPVVLNYLFQFNRRREFDLHNSDGSAALDLSLLTHQVYTGFTILSNDRWKVEAGSNSELQMNIYEGFYFIPNYYRFRQGAYTLASRFTGHSQQELALRYDIQQLTTYRPVSGEIVEESHFYKAVSSSFSGNHKYGHDYKLHYSLGYGFKFPDVNELYAQGLHHGSALIEEGDIKLQKETSYTLNLAGEYTHNKWHIHLEPYFNYFNNFIYLSPTLETQLSIRGAFPVFRYQQNNTIFTGADVDLEYVLIKGLNLKLGGSYLYVKDIERNRFIFGIPSNRVRVSIIREIETFLSLKDIAIDLNGQFVAGQNQYEAESDFVSPPDAYFLLNMSLTAKQQTLPFLYSVKLNNMLNTNYRDYLSRYRYFANEIGFNLNFTVGYTL